LVREKPAFKNLPADLPVEENELAIYGENRSDLGGSDPLLQIFQEAVLTFRTHGGGPAHHESLTPFPPS
jgi:hypothetical protein